MRNDINFLYRDSKLAFEPRFDVIGVTDNPIDHLIEAMKGLLIKLCRIVGEKIVDRQNNLRASFTAELKKPEIQWQTPLQHGQILHMNYVGRRKKEADCKRGEVQHCLE